MGASSLSSTSRLPLRSWTSGMRTPWTPAIIMVMAMRPGSITVPKSAATRSIRGRRLPKTRITRIGWVRVATSSGPALRRATSRSRLQEREEGGHSRSSFPVRWM